MTITYYSNALSSIIANKLNSLNVIPENLLIFLGKKRWYDLAIASYMYGTRKIPYSIICKQCFK